MPFDPDAYLQGAAPSFNPDAYLTAGELPKSAPMTRLPDTSLTQQTGVVARTLAPYATAAAAGAPFGGLPGALAGIGALGVGDLATGVYNLTAPRFGAPVIQTPSETIRNVFAAGGVGRKPATSEQALGASALEGALGATSLTAAGRTLGGKLGNWFAQNPATQTLSGVGGSVTPTAMREYGEVENPYALFAGSLIGGITAAKGGAAASERAARLTDAAKNYATNANISAQALRERAREAFNATDASGVVYDAPALANMAQNVRAELTKTKYDPTSPRYTAVNQALARVDEFAQGSQSIGNLHTLRQDLNYYKRGAGPDQGRMIDDIVNGLDDLVSDARNATFASGADVTQASQTLKGAISDWRRLDKSDRIERLIERASLNSSGPNTTTTFADSLRTQFRTLANNPSQLNRFEPAEREAIRRLAAGADESVTLQMLSRLAPSMQLRDLVRVGTMTGGGALAAHTFGASPLTTALVAGGLTGTGLTARAARNYFAGVDANALAAAVRRGDVKLPMTIPAMEAAQRGIPQAIMQAQQPADYFIPDNAMAR